MKVLFAVSSESISDAIIKRYQKEHKEILSYKNVYYFNAILKEIQKDKSYDRIVISEDLEPFSNSNYDTIDKFIFEKLDNISDEANDGQGKETSIILICTDRHTKGSSFLVKLFGIGIYNALLGNDRSMEQVCRLINQPRLKKEAKMYYKIDADDVSYDPKSEKEVSELEIQNILNHFKKIAKNKEKFADSFDNIASQYTDDQLKIIINCLPINVKAVLEEECPKYQELMSVNGMIQRVGGQASLQTKEAEQKTGIKIDILESKLSQPKMSGPIVIPSSVRTASSKGPIKVRQVERPTEANVPAEEPAKKVVKKVTKAPSPVQEEVKKDDELELDNFDSMLSDLDDDKDTSLVEDTNLVSEKPEVKAEPKTLSSVFEEEDDSDDSLLMSLDDEDSKEDESLLMSLDDGLDEGNSVSMVLDDEDDDFDTGLDDDLDMDLEAGDDLLLDFDDEEEPVEDVLEDDDSLLISEDSDDLDLGLDETEEVKESGLSVSDFMEEDTDSFELDSEDDLELDFSDDDLELVDEDLEEDVSEEDDLLISLDEEETVEELDDLEDADDLLLELEDDKEIIEEDEIEEVSDEDLGIILEDEEPATENKTITIKRGRGRPRKTPIDATPKPKGKRGRPRKNPLPEEDLVEEDDALELVFEDDTDDSLLEESSSSITPDMFLSQEEDVIEEDDTLDILADEDLEEYEEVEIEDDEELDTLDILDAEDEDVSDEDDDSLLVSLDEEEIDDDADLLLEFEEDEEVEEIEDLDDDDLLLLSSDEDIEIVDDEEYTDEVEIPALDDLDDLEDVIEEDDDSLLMSEDSEDLDLELDTEEFSDEMDIPDLDDLEDYEEVEETVKLADEHDDMIPGLDYEEFEEDDYLVSDHHNNSNDDDDDLFLNLDDEITETKKPAAAASVNDFSSNLDEEPILSQSYNTYKPQETNAVESIKPQVDYSMSALNSLMTKDKKIVTFIGTTKNGTSFLINNLAILLSSLGINTAVLDMTQNRNSYYIYTKNEEELRKIAYTSIDKLENGYAEGIRVDKNLTVYTALPNNGKKYTNAEPILSTLIQNHSLVLIDCDFETDPSYFASCQEIYLVQSMDILTIQPLTSFLRDLKAKGVLESEKVRVVINKEIKVRSLTSKTIIGGMSFYNDPAMSFMTELFNKDMVKYCTIPFEDATYSKYLDSMVNCSVSLNGYSNAFKNKLRILGDMVYPLTSVKQSYSNPSQGGPKKSAFSSSMNNTLNQMKNKF